MILGSTHRIIFKPAAPSPVKLLLNKYEGAAAAYSLRLLNADYNGPAINVRHTGEGNPSQPIYFKNGELDAETLINFCGNHDGYITRWYDQSGNQNDATQTIASKQPRIVLNGSVIKHNGKVVLDFNELATLGFVDALGNKIAITYNTAFVVSKINTISLLNYILHQPSPLVGFGFGGTLSGTDGAFIFDGAMKSLSGEDLNQHLGYFNDDGINHQIALDGGTATSFSRSLQLQSTNIGVASSSVNALSYVSEIILYSSSQRGNKSGIENNINNYYKIY